MDIADQKDKSSEEEELNSGIRQPSNAFAKSILDPEHSMINASVVSNAKDAQMRMMAVFE